MPCAMSWLIVVGIVDAARNKAIADERALTGWETQLAKHRLAWKNFMGEAKIPSVATVLTFASSET